MSLFANTRALRDFLTQSLLPVILLVGVIFGSLLFLERTGTMESRREVVVHLSADLLATSVGTAQDAAILDPLAMSTAGTLDSSAPPESDAGDDTATNAPLTVLERRVETAARKVAADSLDSALSDVTAVLAANPHHGSAWFITGKIYAARGQLEEAVAAYARAAEFSGGRAKAVPLYNLGCGLRDLGRQEEAKEAFLQAVDRRPDYREARLNLALLLAKDPAAVEDAERAYDQLLRLYPDYSIAYYDRGLLRKGIGADSTALEDFRLATRYDSTMTKAWILIARTSESFGRTEDCIDAWRHAVEIDPTSTRAWRGLLLGLAEQDRYEEATELGWKAVSFHPKWSAAWYNLGIAAAKVGRYEDARRAYERAIELEPHDFRPWLNLGVVQAREKRSREAIHCYEEALAREPGSVSARYNLALELRRKGDLGQALLEGERVYRLDPTNEKARSFLRTTAQRLVDKNAEDREALRVLSEVADTGGDLDARGGDELDTSPSD